MAKHKCKVPDPPADTNRWMGTYGDMVTLLMAFFVMLFAVSETDNQKFEAFVSGLAGPFDNPAVELGLVGGADLEEASVSPISLIAPQPGIAEGMGEDTEATEELEEANRADAQLEEVREELEDALADVEVPISADLRDDERGLVVSISTDEVLFPIGSAEISPEGEALIAEIAPILVGAPNTVVVEGHTDNRPLDTGGYTNWNLSTDRAVAVVELLGERHGLPFDRTSAAGYGEHRPLVPNTSAANQSINRRVEILIVGLDISGDGSPPPPSEGQQQDPQQPAVPPEDDPGSGPGEVVEVPADEQPEGVIDLPAPPQAAPPAADDDVATASAGAPTTLATILGQ